MKQLIVISDMEGASGIFEDRSPCYHGTEEWKTYGRMCMTSDIKAVCEAANEWGIDQIFYYDAHCAGSPEFNTILEDLPDNVVVADVPDRCFLWRRIRGQAVQEPIGLITVGQHARYGEPDGYHEHTIQSPPIKSVTVDGIHIAEIGQAVLAFNGTKFLANIGCAASMKEAMELNPDVVKVPVKDKGKGWEPALEETYPLIKKGVKEALDRASAMEAVQMDGPNHFEMALVDGWCFEAPAHISWKGTFSEKVATWEAPSVEIGLELFNEVRACVKRMEVL